MGTDLFNVEEKETTTTQNNIKITKVILENYRNFGYKEFDFNGKSKIIVGKNGLGKTNIIEAIFWALNGKLFSGDSRSDRVGIIPVGSELGTKTKVSIEFEPQFKVEKVYFEKYEKETEEFKGSDTTYYINGALIKTLSVAMQTIKNYLGHKVLDDKFSTTPLKALDTTSLFYNMNTLNTLDYSILRELIIDIVGEVDYALVIKSNKEKYKRLVEPLSVRGGDVEALYSSLRTEKFGDKNKEGLDDKIETKKRLVTEFEKSANKEIDLEAIKVAQEALDKIDLEITKLNNQKNMSSDEIIKDIDFEISKKHNELNTARENIRTLYETALKNHENPEIETNLKNKEKSIQDLRNKRLDQIEKISDERTKLSRLTQTLISKENQRETLLEEKEKLVEEYKELSTPKESGTQITCPHCDKPFDLNHTKEHQEVINEKIKDINKKGEVNKLDREQLEEGITTLSYEKEQFEKTILKLEKSKDDIDKHIDILKEDLVVLSQKKFDNDSVAPILDFEVEPILTIKKDVEALEKKRSDAENNLKETMKEFDNQIELLKEARVKYVETTSQEATRNSYLKNAEEHRKEVKTINKRLIEVEELLLLIKELKKDMFTMLSEKVEDKFGKNIQFRLFKMNIDGTVDTRVCDMLVKDVHGTFVNLKNINSGMYPVRVIEFLTKVKEHYGLPKSFILIDEMVGLLDKQHREWVYSFGEQILATGYQELDTIEIKE